MEIITQEFDNQERVTDQETKAGRKLGQLVAIILALAVVLALAIPQDDTVPVGELPRPHSQAVLDHFCQVTPEP